MQKLKYKIVIIILILAILFILLFVVAKIRFFTISRSYNITNFKEYKLLDFPHTNDDILGNLEFEEYDKGYMILNRMENKLYILNKHFDIEKEFNLAIDSNEEVVSIKYFKNFFLLQISTFDSNFEIIHSKLMLANFNGSKLNILSEREINNQEFLIYSDKPYLITNKYIKEIDVENSKNILISKNKQHGFNRFVFFDNGIVTKKNQSSEIINIEFYSLYNFEFIKIYTNTCRTFNTLMDTTTFFCSDYYVILKGNIIGLPTLNKLEIHNLSNRTWVYDLQKSVMTQNKIFNKSLAMSNEKIFLFKEKGDKIELIMLEPGFSYKK